MEFVTMYPKKLSRVLEENLLHSIKVSPPYASQWGWASGNFLLTLWFVQLNNFSHIITVS